MPLEVYELALSIGLTECPDCESEGWIEVEGSAWYNLAWALHTFTRMKPCTTCNCEGLVLAALEPIETEPETYPTPWLLAA